ncbi:lipoprotein [Porticoccaceae bacterium LTM1]|nr:lipoprotein [Porticoccaceae bacterium LTM1]
MMTIVRRLISITVLLISVLTLSACGNKGPLVPAEPESAFNNPSQAI